MNPIQIPENLSELGDDALETLTTSIAAAAEELLSQDEITDEVNDELERLADARDAITALTKERAAAAAARQERRDSAAARFADPEPEAEVDDVPAAETAPDADPEPETPVAETEPDPEPDVVVPDDASSIDDTAPAAVEPAAQVPAVSAATTEPAPTPAPAPAVAPEKGLAAMSAKRSRSTTARPARADFMTATAHALGGREGNPFDNVLDLATAITKKRHSFSVVPAGVKRDFVPIASGMKEIEHAVGGDLEQNFQVLRDLQVGAEALVASGAGCAPYSPSYEFFRLAEPQNPVEAGTPVVQAPRGGIRYIVPMSVAAAAGAIDISAQDRDYEPYDETTNPDGLGPKACISVDCADIAEEEVSAVSQCVTFDNLRYKVFPEQVAAFLEDVAVQFASTKEVFYLDYIKGKSTAATSAGAYGASRSLLRDWTHATVAYRKRHGMRRNAVINVLAPDIAIDIIKLDIALSNDRGWPGTVSDAEVESVLRSLGIVAIWYNDNPTGTTPNQKFAGAQGAGALAVFPTSIVSYVYAPGTFVRLDGGTLDVGLVRDSVLNRTNDLQLFMEEWIGMAKLGFESVQLTSTINVNGAAPNYVTALAA
ncbi:major capsid protein [Desertimonas flava]|uniref:major capsid protein n=1 Tax=Desertimonas flava TaxID=2064846 RepID=UPI000E3418EB|nr:major capsid protein [Desertimonas flava]